MSGFNVLYRSLHNEPKEPKKADKDGSSSQAKGEAQSGSTVHPFRALVAKIF